jgi:putative tryptophan/tyrosine transport system substrate-binding protein
MLAACAAIPSRALAQEKIRRVAWLGAGRAGAPSPFFSALQAGFRELNWHEGRNLALTLHLTEGTPEESNQAARQMLATNPELIMAYGREVFSVHRLQTQVPVVFGFSGNPVDAGFVQSFARPGGNMTGISLMSLDLAGKRIELLKELAPNVRRMGVLTRLEHPGEPRERAASEEIARRAGLTLVYAPIRAATDLGDAFRTIEQQRCDSLLVFPDGVMIANASRIAQFAAERRIASVSGWGTFTESGFLLSYGPNLRDSYKDLARFADRILRGTRPAELPVELPRTVELVVNNRTANALGLKIPQSIALRADRVIA